MAQKVLNTPSDQYIRISCSGPRQEFFYFSVLVPYENMFDGGSDGPAGSAPLAESDAYSEVDFWILSVIGLSLFYCLDGLWSRSSYMKLSTSMILTDFMSG